MTMTVISDPDHPQYDQLTQVDDLDAATLWALQARARQQQKGLIASVANPIGRGFLADNGFESVGQTYVATLNIRDFSGEPVVPVADLDSDLQTELVLLLRDHYERTHRFNPPVANVDYDKWLFGHQDFDPEYSIVRLAKQHVVAAILVFKAGEDYELQWTFGDDVTTLHELWRDLLGILPVGSRLQAAFESTDVLAMSVYEMFNWHNTQSVQTTMIWHDTANNLRII